MKLKGDLESIGVAELFKTLADQRATGILVVTSPMGDKTIALSSGEIAVATDNLSERTRLGDLLVARGRLTEVQLTEALKAQKLNPRAKIGDLMVKLGMITPEIIGEAVKFQVEEQVLDLYTWKDANFEFDSDKSIDDIYDPNSAGGPLQRLNINVGPLIADTAKREDIWKQIQARIPTPYLCFKTTPKGEELVSKSPRNTQAIIKLLKEGRTLETTVKRSCIGRINVCTAIIKLLDDGWIMPTPAAELRFLASEHRFKKRYLDSLYIYRRLLDSASSPVDKAELERSIQDIIEEIHEAAASGDSPEGSEIVSFKDAAQRFKRRQKARRAALAIFGVTAVIVAAILVFQQLAQNPKLPDEYVKILSTSNAKLEAGDYDGAIKLWDDFYKSISDKGSQLANFARDHQAMAISKQKTFLKQVFKICTDLEAKNKLDEAKKEYKEFAEKYPDFEDTPAATEAVARIEKLQEDQKKTAATESQRKLAEEAIGFLNKKDYSSAKGKLKRAETDLPPDSPFLKEVQDGLKKIQEVEDRINAMKVTADAEVRNNEGEKAIDDYNKAGNEWPDLPVS
jgi:tetratricopeptide (TPR) repeat protein